MTDNLELFEKLNVTAESIYDLAGSDVLIILNDGTNLTCWDEVDDRADVMFVSENLSGKISLKERYCDLSGLKAIVISNISDEVTSMEDMFRGCFKLTDIKTIGCDTSNVSNMRGMFVECNSLRDISFLADFDVSAVEDMSYMFEVCYSMSDVAPLAGWDVSRLENAECMFYDCHILEDISALKSWNIERLENIRAMFGNCNYLKDISPLSSWGVSDISNMESLFEGCDYLDDVSPLAGWDVSNAEKMDGMFSNTNITDATCLNSWKISPEVRKDLIFRDCDLIKKPAWQD